jgi:hypothetical protein
MYFLKRAKNCMVEAVDDHIEVRSLPQNPVEYFCGALSRAASKTVFRPHPIKSQETPVFFNHDFLSKTVYYLYIHE